VVDDVFEKRKNERPAQRAEHGIEDSLGVRVLYPGINHEVLLPDARNRRGITGLVQLRRSILNGERPLTNRSCA